MTEAPMSSVETARPLDEWHEDFGAALWWRFPIEEPPYSGSPLDSDWPGYHTHWTPLPPAPAMPATPVTPELCEDCRRPVAAERKTRGAHIDRGSCGARFSAHYELECKRITVKLLRGQLDELRSKTE